MISSMPYLLFCLISSIWFRIFYLLALPILILLGESTEILVNILINGELLHLGDMLPDLFSGHNLNQDVTCDVPHVALSQSHSNSVSPTNVGGGSNPPPVGEVTTNEGAVPRIRPDGTPYR